MITCKIGLHFYQTTPNGMLRKCRFCARWEINRNNSVEPKRDWWCISDDYRKTITEDWHDAGKIL